MRNPVFRSRTLTPVAVVALLAVTAASCSNDALRLREPLFTGSTQNQKEIIGDDGQPMAVGGGNTVASAPLPPPPPVEATPVAYAPPAASTTPGATTHKVRSGDTLYSVSRQYGVSVGDIVALNSLSSAGQIQVGQTLQLPAGASPAPKAVADASAGRIALASADPKQIPAAPKASPTDSTAAKPPAVPAAPSIPVETGKSEASAEMANAAIDAADAPSANGTSFRWPVRGRIISGFGSKPNGERNDGINLAVPEGTTVKAAEAGTVIYAGNELEGYGNLVLVRHADGWVSAYAHNKQIMVKRGDKVRRGQTVGEAGMSGSVSSPQVHFELRQGSKPVNPLDYLAGA
jgi:murein DD-endopeptidase MepM/ murein hydrolase activator NlpD